MPEGDTLFRTAAGLRPYLVGRDVVPPAPRGPGRSRRSSGSSASTIDAVDAQGKNLLIRFDGGLELRTHLRMNGSWHRYRPGERWRRPPARARLVLEVPGAVAVCFDAPVVELFEAARRGRSTRRSSALGPDLPRAGLRRRRGAPPPARPDARRHRDRRRPARPAGAGRHRQRLQERDRSRSSGSSPFAPVGELDDATLDRLIATARRLLVANADARRGPERVTTDGDRGAPGPLYVYGRARPAVPPLPDADRRDPPGHGPAAVHVLVPGLPGSSTMTSTIDVRCASARGRLALRGRGATTDGARGRPRGDGRERGRRTPGRRSTTRPACERLVYETFDVPARARAARRRSWPRST